MNLRCLLPALACATSLFAQIDGEKIATNLRHKYGPELTVDHAPNGHVCRIHLPGTTAQTSKGFVDELVSKKDRGKKIRSMGEATGVPMVLIDEYEFVTFARLSQGADPAGTTITFTQEHCPEPATR